MKNFSIWILRTALIAFIACASSNVYANYSDKNDAAESVYSNENNTLTVCYQQGQRYCDYTSCDATSEYLYFAYSDHNCVDVYDTQGVFLYSFLPPDCQNGTVWVRCLANKVFIRSKNGTVYIFEGEKQIVCIANSKASEIGYDFYWFYDHKPCIKVDSQWISRLNEDGSVLEQLPTPMMVRKTIPLSLQGWQSLIAPVTVTLLLLACAYVISFRKNLSH